MNTMNVVADPLAVMSAYAAHAKQGRVVKDAAAGSRKIALWRLAAFFGWRCAPMRRLRVACADPISRQLPYLFDRVVERLAQRRSGREKS
jgi:hypothetical protein